MTKTESQTLAETLDQVHKLSKFYIGKLQGADVLKEFEVEGTKLNCVLWVLSHMTWGEHALILKLLSGTELDIPWLGRFRTATDSTPQADWPSFVEVLKCREQVHEACLNFISTLDTNLLDEPVYIKVSDWHTDKRHAIMHAIRHEGVHVGHLSWLCKLLGVKTI